MSSVLARFQNRLCEFANALPKDEAKKWLLSQRLLVLWENEELDLELREHLGIYRKKVIAGNAAMIKVFQDVLDALHPIPVVPLKGIVLLQKLYSKDPGLRPFRDIDLLVPKKNIRDAVAALTQIGFRENIYSWSLRNVNDQRVLDSGWASVDLHTRLDFAYGRNSTWEALALAPETIHDRPVFVLSDATILVHLILHCYFHRMFSSLLQVHEILAFSENMTKGSAEEVTEVAQNMRCKNVLVATTNLLRQVLGEDVLSQVNVSFLRPSSWRLGMHRDLFVPKKLDLFIPFASKSRLLERFHAPLLNDNLQDGLAELIRMARYSLISRWVG